MAVHFSKKQKSHHHYFEHTEHFTSSRLNTIVNHLCKILRCVLLSVGTTQLVYLKAM